MQIINSVPLKRVMHQVVILKSNVEWGLHEIEDSKDMESLLQKEALCEQIPQKGESL